MAWRRAVAALMAVLVGSCVAMAAGRVGVLVVGHGSPSARWNQVFLRFADGVRGELGPGYEVRPGFLEMARPSAAASMRGLCRGGKPVIVLPAFVFPTEHSEEDLPAVLGLRYSPDVVKRLVEERADFIRPSGPVVMLPTMSGWGMALGQVLARRARLASRRPEREAVLVLLHGSARYDSLIAAAIEASVVPALRRVGFVAVEHVSVGMGEILARMMPLAAEGESLAQLRAQLEAALERAGRGREAVIVVAAYVATTPRQLFARWPERTRAGAEVRVVDAALLPSPLLVQAAAEMVRRAAAWLGGLGESAGAVKPRGATAGAGGRGR